MKLKKRRDDDDEESKLTRKQKAEIAASIYAGLVEGQTEDQIVDDLGITLQHYQIAKKFLLVSKGDEEENLTPKERFARYVIEQDRNIADLNDLVENLNSKTQYSVILGAIRMRADISDRVISTGQTLGIISKEPEKKILIGGISVAEMKDGDLRKGVFSALSGLGKMFEKYGDGMNMRALSPGPLHRGEATIVESPVDNEGSALGKPTMSEESGDKKNRAKSGKRSAGRRRVRE